MATKKCTACGKVRKMAKGGNPCPEGTYWAEDGSCKPIAKQPGLLAGPSVKIAGAIIGAGLAGMGRVLSADKRADKKAAKKVVKTATKTMADKKVMKKGGWIDSAIKKPGALREQLGVKKGEKIPKAKLAAAAKKGGKLGQRARLAITLSKMSKK
jgi:hypothetical protein